MGKGNGGKSTGSGDLVSKLLENSSYDKDFLNASITIEIDIETGQVYSAFYATRCDGLAYDGDDKEILDITAAGITEVMITAENGFWAITLWRMSPM